MSLWAALAVYALILVWAALLGWLPFVLLERISLVGQLETDYANAHSAATGSRVTCPACGQPNERSFDYCGSCGGKIPHGTD
jgi:hypothetical protein